MSSSAARQAASFVSRTMTCNRIPKSDFSSVLLGSTANVGDLACYRVRWLTPGEIDVVVPGGQVVPHLRRSADVERWMRCLHRRIEEFCALHAKMLALEIDRLTR